MPNSLQQNEAIDAIQCICDGLNKLRELGILQCNNTRMPKMTFFISHCIEYNKRKEVFDPKHSAFKTPVFHNK